MISAPRWDCRRGATADLTRSKDGRGPADGTEKQAREMAELNRAILRGEIKPAAERLADQHREMLGKWAERGIR